MLKRTIYETCQKCGQQAAELLPDGSVRVAHHCPNGPPGPPAPPVTYRVGEVESSSPFGAISPCTCWTKAPTVPVFRDRYDHLSDCPLKDSGLPVGVAHTSLVDQATRLKEVVAENEQLRGLLKHLRLYFAAERACHIEDRRPTHCEDMELERIDKALQEPPR